MRRLLIFHCCVVHSTIVSGSSWVSCHSILVIWIHTKSNMSQYQISPVTEVFYDHHWKSKSVVQLKWLKLPFLCLLHISENSIVWDPRYYYLTSCVITDKLFCVWCHLYILCLLLWWTSLQTLFGSAQRLKPGNRSLKRTEFCPSALLVRVFSRRE